MKAIALIDCNNFYVSCERLLQPHLRRRPVIVLSNNDGCVVSRSQEVKDMGIPIGVPLFEIRDRVEKENIVVFSSNYTLYGDISSRVHDAISHFFNQIENYSIDEAFAIIELNRYSQTLFEMGAEVRSAVKQWTGIPTSVGIGPTKTLAKVAGGIAKKLPEGVFDLTDPKRQDDVLSGTDLLDIWGVNRATAGKLNRIGIRTAKDLRDMDLRSGRKLLTVVGGRLINELRGIPNISLEQVRPRKKSILCSRSFGHEVKSFSEMQESVINFLSAAAERMRRQKLIASAVNLFIETNRFKEKGLYTNSATLKIQPTDSTRELIDYGLRILRALYRPGYGYRKSGVTLLGLLPQESETARLFGDKEYRSDRQLMAVIDRINSKYGRHTVRFGLGAKNHVQWQMNREHLSPSYTTDIGQILRIVL